MSTKAELKQALLYVMSLAMGRHDREVGGSDRIGQVLEILHRHLDDDGDELVAKCREHWRASIDDRITDLQADKDGLRTS